jgi:hypothetical protein
MYLNLFSLKFGGAERTSFDELITTITVLQAYKFISRAAQTTTDHFANVHTWEPRNFFCSSYITKQGLFDLYSHLLNRQMSS